MKVLNAKQSQIYRDELTRHPVEEWGAEFLSINDWQRRRDIRCAYLPGLMEDRPAVILVVIRDDVREPVGALMPEDGEYMGLRWWDSDDVRFHAVGIFEEVLDRMETEEWNACPRVIVRTDSGALRQLDLSPYGFPERDFWSCIECYDDDHGTHLCELDGDDFLGRDVGDDFVPLDPSEVGA